MLWSTCHINSTKKRQSKIFKTKRRGQNLDKMLFAIRLHNPSWNYCIQSSSAVSIALSWNVPFIMYITTHELELKMPVQVFAFWHWTVFCLSPFCLMFRREWRPWRLALVLCLSFKTLATLEYFVIYLLALEHMKLIHLHMEQPPLNGDLSVACICTYLFYIRIENCSSFLFGQKALL